ncbi:response regulator transcription factor [Herpetosiphon giganteus]|uniref:response regulator transcription factor n=1 Tax=Herpetosiphon giganteus TaxID=2029754 RepID=UPI001959CD95|nr:response regulator transcription factor [Herpetosiphon giganteus]MBM7845500.1 DNA-binding response OmpR family regulator [Herpetosiphon giganteus]
MAKIIVIIEDEERIAHWMQLYLEQASFTTYLASDGLTGLALVQQHQPSLVVLDLMLPKLDGLSVFKAIRQTKNTPIIMVTARSSDEERIQGLELGADDYVGKPFNARELVARVRAVLRRSQPLAPSQTLKRGPIELDLTQHQCTVNQQPVELSKIQLALLATFMRHPNQILSREQLLEAVFAGDYAGFDRSLDAHIARLRQRIEHDRTNPQYIITVYGLGYKFVD